MFKTLSCTGIHLCVVSIHLGVGGGGGGVRYCSMKLDHPQDENKFLHVFRFGLSQVY